MLSRSSVPIEGLDGISAAVSLGMAQQPFTLRGVVAVSGGLVAHSKRLIRQGNELLSMALALEAQVRNILHAEGLAKALKHVQRNTRKPISRSPRIPRERNRQTEPP
jgi:hypothetical protein